MTMSEIFSFPDRETLAKMSRYIKRFSSPRRLEVVFLLLKHGELCVTELVELTGIPQGRLSAHLVELKRCNDVITRRKDNFIYYSIADDKVSDFVNLARTLVEEHCAGPDTCC